MVRKLRAALLAAAVVGSASQLGCIFVAAGAVGYGIGAAVRGNKDPDDQWLLPDGGKPVRTPTKKPDPPADSKPVVHFDKDDVPPPEKAPYKAPPPDSHMFP